MYQAKKVKDFPIVKQGLVYIAYPALLSVLFAIGALCLGLAASRLIGLEVLFWTLSAFFLLLGIFVLFFFRNPRRERVSSGSALLSPADGKVMSVIEMDEPSFIGGKAVKVSIFLSLFNVHINRSPMDGTVRYHHYRDGQMLPAFKSHASEINERNTVGIESPDGYRILVHQITGFIARRIVWWVKPGDVLAKGERFGLIRFGSCTEIVMPLGTSVLVSAGQTVRAGMTIIGERTL